MTTRIRPLFTLLLTGLLAFGCDDSASVEEALDAAPEVDTSAVEDTSLTEDTAAEDTSVTEDTALDTTEPQDSAEPKDIAEDSAEPVGDCEVTTTAQDGVTHTCAIDAATMLGCEDLAACLCEHTEPATEEERQRCIESLVYPRGMITLADYCTLSGGPFSEIAPRSLADLTPGYDTRGLEVSFTEGCAEVAAFTLWGDAPTLSLSIGVEGETLSEAPWSMEDFDLISPPLLELEHVERYHSGDARFTLTEAGRAAAAQADALAGRIFVLHAGDRVLLAGRVASELMSASLEGPVIVAERLLEGRFTLDQGYPAQGTVTDPSSFGLGWMTAALAASRRLLDAACVTDATCLDGWSCEAERCASP